MNRNWKKLKHSTNQVPTSESFLPYVLVVLQNEEETTKKVIEERVIELLQIPQELMRVSYPNYPDDSILLNRLSFTLSNLYKANAIQRSRRGVYKMTEDGKMLLKQYGETLTLKILEQQPAYQRYMQELTTRNKRKGVKYLDEEEYEEKMDVDVIVANRNNQLEIELLDKIRQVTPGFFEQLVVDLLNAMGYSGENGEATVTSRTNDGGIDGIINQDPLGTSTVYVQAKRYQASNTVGRPEVQAFYGALAAVNADRGVFLTTSKFSQGAQEFAKNQGIVLVDGLKLTELMLSYRVGVEVAQKYELFRIDTDYFES